MNTLAVSIIIGIFDVIFTVCCILLFIYVNKLGKISEIQRELENARRLCENARLRIVMLDRKIYRQEQILSHKKQVEELARSIALEIEKNNKKEKNYGK